MILKYASCDLVTAILPPLRCEQLIMRLPEILADIRVA
jgi:hypothetical protein